MRKILSQIFACFLSPVAASLSLVCLSSTIYSQAPPSWSSSDMYLALRKLNVLGSVLYVAAHPDDENTRLITYFSKDRLYRTGYLSMTRGDGGQNLIGDEQGIELGLIRTQELLAARRIDGGEQFFSRAFDFGFSKNPEETFTKWDKEKILSDVVWVIRKFQPDVIVTRFPTTGEGGHGHHTASAILANEAFTAAADPNKFPGQLKNGVQVWQAKRIVWNTFNFGTTNTITPDQFKVDVGGYSALLGKSYGEIAAESRSQHKSQGFGVPASRGESFESFKATGGTAPVNDLMDGVDLTWKRVPGGMAIEKQINKLIAAFDLLHPEKSVKGLVELYQSISKLPDGYWKKQKLKEVRQLIEQCSGLFIDATTTEQFAVQTDSVKINFSLNNRLGADVVLQKIQVDNFDSSFTYALAKNKNLNFSKTFFVPSSKPVTQPYWLENKMAEGYFNVKDPLQIGQPDVDAAYKVAIDIKIFGELFNYTRDVKYKFTDPVKGELYEPLVLLPPFDVTLSQSLSLIPADADRWQSEATIRANKDVSNISINTTGQSFPGSFSLMKKQAKDMTVLGMMHVKDQTKPFFITYPVTYGKDSISTTTFKKIHYNHIPYINYFENVVVKAVSADLKIYGKKIGYIIGAGDKVPEALEQMGYEVTPLTEKELSRNNLQQFDAIIAGVRAYNTNDWLSKYYDKLVKYVEGGGNYIVQYNTANFISSIKTKIGPYSFDIARTRVTDENAPVKFLKPEHEVLNFPNKITQDDFKGWVQERSIYHASNWDKNFETILSMNDPGENADEGSLIIAKYGKGYFTYTGLVFFRELPAGVPGAYRLIANLIALNRKKAF